VDAEDACGEFDKRGDGSADEDVDRGRPVRVFVEGKHQKAGNSVRDGKIGEVCISVFFLGDKNAVRCVKQPAKKAEDEEVEEIGEHSGVGRVLFFYSKLT